MPIWKRIQKGKKNGTKTLVFTNELPNWKRIRKGKKTGKKTEKTTCPIENEYIKETKRRKKTEKKL